MDAMNGDAPPALYCVVESVRAGISLQLRGRIDARAPASGRYRLEVAKTSRDGSSRIAQAGAFDAAPGMPAAAGLASVDFASGTRVAARLRGEALGQSFGCDLEETSHD